MIVAFQSPLNGNCNNWLDTSAASDADKRPLDLIVVSIVKKFDVSMHTFGIVHRVYQFYSRCLEIRLRPAIEKSTVLLNECLFRTTKTTESLVTAQLRARRKLCMKSWKRTVRERVE